MVINSDIMSTYRIICNNNANLLPNTTGGQCIFDVPKRPKEYNDEELLVTCIDKIFEQKYLMEPYVFYDKGSLVSALTFEKRNVVNDKKTVDNDIRISLRNKHNYNIYILEFVGISTHSIYYIGTSEQTFKNVFSDLRKRYNLPSDVYKYKEMDIDANTPLEKCNFSTHGGTVNKIMNT